MAWTVKAVESHNGKVASLLPVPHSHLPNKATGCQSDVRPILGGYVSLAPHTPWQSHFTWWPGSMLAVSSICVCTYYMGLPLFYRNWLLSRDVQMFENPKLSRISTPRRICVANLVPNLWILPNSCAITKACDGAYQTRCLYSLGSYEVNRSGNFVQGCYWKHICQQRWEWLIIGEELIPGYHACHAR